jgi:sodium-dependent dicarboxylate transporter 2/3/5
MRKTWGVVLGIFLALFPLLVPAGEGFTPQHRRMAAVTLLMAAWWITEAIPIPATALVPLAAFPLLGILSSKETAPTYGDHLVFLFLGGFLIASAMERWGLHRRIAMNIIAAMGAGTRALLLGFMVATAFLSMWISNTATTLMMLPIAVAVVNHLADRGRDPDLSETVRRELGSILMLGIAFAASIGGVGTLIGTPPNIVFTGFSARLFPDAPEITFSQWMEIGLPFVLVLLPVAFLVVWKIGGRIPAGQLDAKEARSQVQRERKRLGPMSRPERTVLVVFVTTAILWITRRGLDLGQLQIPGWSHLFPWSGKIHDATVAMTMAVLLFLIPVTDPESGRHRPVLLWSEAVGRIPWGILLLFGGGFALARGFRETGLDVWLGGHLARFTAAPPPLLILATSLLAMMLTEVTSNTATTTLLMPILAAAARGAGLHPYLLMLPATLAASCAFMLPVATPPNAIVFGSGWLTIPRMARTGVTLNLVSAVLITLLVLTLGRWALDMGNLSLPPWASPGM